MDGLVQAVAPVDLGMALLLLVSTLMGLWRGFIYEALALVNWVAAFVVARVLAEPVMVWLGMDTLAPLLRYWLGFGVVFVLALLLGGWLASLVRRWVARSGLRAADRSLGGLFGVVRATAMLMLGALLVNSVGWNVTPLWTESKGARALDEMVDAARPMWSMPSVAVKE
jgi:membrane protein required for colicin V production